MMVEERPSDSAYAATLLTEELGAQAVLLSYRLASNPDGQFPTALQDTVTAYQYLLEQGIPLSRIIVTGNLAGAHLALSFLRYVSEGESTLPAPIAALLFCPAIEYAAYWDPGCMTPNRNYQINYLEPDFASWGSVRLRETPSTHRART